uniref:glycosyltransferase family 4 protein n=1 Tax=Azospirillum argentinense TaxID=2970906 RepID=UPI0010C0E210|nr:glycosyltransferase family 4 protein [Azospirillum argentinense]
MAFPTGALADLVEPGVTGFLVKDAEEMARAIEDCEGWTRRLPRRRPRPLLAGRHDGTLSGALRELVAGGTAAAAGVA